MAVRSNPKAKSQTGGPERPRTPPGTILFAVGDIHGRLDLLERLSEHLAVETEAARREGKGVIAVFLGDYIDRGPDGAGVIEHLIRLRDQGACETVFLRGNHEDLLLGLVDGDEDTPRWLDYGGLETVRSYGVSARTANADSPVEALRRAAGAIPPEHIAFLRETEMHLRLGDYIFVHAGLRPDRPLEAQDDIDKMWFRYEDDRKPPAWAGTVVHGHTVHARPVRGRGRIGLDTGAYKTDALTALRLEDDRQAFIKVGVDTEDGEPSIDFWDRVDPAFADPASRGRRPATTRKPPARKQPQRSPVVIAGLATGAAAAVVVLGAVALYTPWLDPAPDPAPPPIAQIWSAPAPVATPGAISPPATVAVASVPRIGEPMEDAALRRLTEATSPVRESAQPPITPTQVSNTPPPVKATGPVRVQIAAAPSPEAARREWTSVAGLFPGAMAAKGLETEPVQVGDRTLLRTLISGFPSEAAARAFCAQLREAGHDCIVRAQG